MLRAVFACAFLSSSLLADVVPHCGPPTVTEHAPGELCGHFGPRDRFDCRAPGACFVLEGGGDRCTVACASDADCAPLGPGFTCSGRGKPYMSEGPDEPRSLCSRPEMAAPAEP